MARIIKKSFFSIVDYTLEVCARHNAEAMEQRIWKF